MNAARWRLLFQRLDTPLVPLAVTAGLYLVFVLLVLARRGWDPSVFVTAGDAFVDRASAPVGLRILRDSHGYDGEFYYRLALDPLTAEREAFGITLDNPVYRQQRIGYPLLAWAASLGTPRLVPVALIGVNLAALCLLAWAAAILARDLGQHALFGLAFSLYPGFVLTLRRDLAEILEGCLLLGGLLLLSRARHLAAAALLAAAVLTRETAVLVPLAGLVAALPALRQRARSTLAPLVVYLGVLAVALAWQAFLWLRWGEVATLSGGVAVGAPFAGVTAFVAHAWSVFGRTERFGLLEVAYLALFAGVCALALRRSTVPDTIKLAWLLYLGLLLALSQAVWVDDWAFLRVAAELYLLGCLMILGVKNWRLSAATLAVTIGLWGVLAWDVLRYR